MKKQIMLSNPPSPARRMAAGGEGEQLSKSLIWQQFRGRLLITLLISLASLFALTACQSSEYEQLLKAEKAIGEMHNEIFDAFYFGMEKQEFFDVCMEGNRLGTHINSPVNWVRMNLKDTKGEIIHMDFYPDFVDSKISAMPVEFSFKAWAPWNDSTHTDVLFPEVEKIMQTWFGNDFIEMERDGKHIWVDVDGNRQVVMTKRDDKSVYAKITDLNNKD